MNTSSVNILSLLALLGFAVSCAPSPESWSKHFADHATNCGTANLWEHGAGPTVFQCTRSAVASGHPFTAQVDVLRFPGVVNAGAEQSVVRGRAIGIDVHGTYETFVFAATDGLWFGPCQTLDLGGATITAFAGCQLARQEPLVASHDETARFLFEIPAADQGHVPWLR